MERVKGIELAIITNAAVASGSPSAFALCGVFSK